MKAKSGAVMKNQRILVVYKTTSVPDTNLPSESEWCGETTSLHKLVCTELYPQTSPCIAACLWLHR